MRKFMLCLGAVLVLAVPTAVQAGERSALSSREARTAARIAVTNQAERLQQLPGLTVAGTVSTQVDRIARRRVVVPVAFALHWADGRNFVCLTDVHVTRRGPSVHVRMDSFDCG